MWRRMRLRSDGLKSAVGIKKSAYADSAIIKILSNPDAGFNPSSI